MYRQTRRPLTIGIYVITALKHIGITDWPTFKLTSFQSRPTFKLTSFQSRYIYSYFVICHNGVADMSLVFDDHTQIRFYDIT